MQARAARRACSAATTPTSLLVACNTPARMAKGAVEELRGQGVKAGLFRPVTLWPFPIDALATLPPRRERLVVVEASAGQLEDELRLASQPRGVAPPPIESVRRMGGILPQPARSSTRVLALEEVVA